MDRKKRELTEDGKAIVDAVSADAPPESSPKTLTRSEELFRQGEDLYALGMYQQAIHVWTRILFLERGDSRTKSAIERAKRSVAERQRELDVELAAATRDLEGGDVEAAAARVRHVLSVDPRHEEGHQLAAKLTARKRHHESLQAGESPVAKTARSTPIETIPASKRGVLLRVSHGPPPALRTRANTSPLKMAGFVFAVIFVFASGALYLHLNWESIVSDGAFANGAMSAGGGAASPVDAAAPSASELYYYNGARLYEKGRYRQALAELSLVARDDAVFDRARSLILRIEERLLRGGELSERALESAPLLEEVTR